MRVAIRVDGSNQLGWGHVVRCLALGETLKARGSQVEWLTSELPHELSGWLTARGIAARFSTTKSLDGRLDWRADAESTRAIVGADGFHADWLIVDHYGLDHRWESAVAHGANRVLAVDDLANRPHACVALLDQTPGRGAADYDGLAPAGCRLLMGPQWALLRPQFAARRQTALEFRCRLSEVTRILVNLGGTDVRGLLQPVLRGIARSGVAAVADVLIGSDQPDLAGSLRKWAGEGIEVNVLANVGDVAAVMARAHLAVGAAGTSALERCALGLPTLLILIAENQRSNAMALDACGAARYIGDWQDVTAEKIAAELTQLAGDLRALQSMAAVSGSVCDGRGVDRVHLVLSGAAPAAEGGEVTLRLAGPEDEQLMHRWQSHPSTRLYARNRGVPTPSEHHEWLARMLANPEVLLMLIEQDGVPAGVLRLDPPDDRGEHEVSILVAPDSARRGIAAAALGLADRLVPGWTLRAEVLPGNEASLRLFSRAGYERVGPTTFLRRKLEG
jgi:UDP-2,4-diacetamido-2,4,6-trideoxy-beta-L-altropyranose hydrolase